MNIKKINELVSIALKITIIVFLIGIMAGSFEFRVFEKKPKQKFNKLKEF